MRVPQCVAWTVSALAFSVALHAQPPTTFVIPNLGGPTATGNGSSGNTPSGTGARDFRGQWAYDSSEWPDDFPRMITRIRLRASDFATAATTWAGGTYGGVKIMMSTATANYDALSATFSLNHGKDLVVVYDTNPITLKSPPVVLKGGAFTGAGIPGVYYYDVILSKPFTYDPTKGDLLADFAVDGTKFTGSTASAANTTQHKVRRWMVRQAATAPNPGGQHKALVATSINTFWGLTMEISGPVPTGTYASFVATSVKVGLPGLKVTFQDQRPIYLSDVATVQRGKGVDKIDRRNRMQEVQVSADLLPGFAAGTVQLEIDNWMEEQGLIQEGVEYAPLGQADIQARESGYLFSAIGLGIILVYMLLASLYDNLLYPFIIQLAQPQALVGAILALIITNKTLNIVGMIGIIALVGLVGKNAILLVDYTNTLRARGMPRFEALVQSGRTRQVYTTSSSRTRIPASAKISVAVAAPTAN